MDICKSPPPVSRTITNRRHGYRQQSTWTVLVELHHGSSSWVIIVDPQQGPSPWPIIMDMHHGLSSWIIILNLGSSVRSNVDHPPVTSTRSISIDHILIIDHHGIPSSAFLMDCRHRSSTIYKIILDHIRGRTPSDINLTYGLTSIVIRDHQRGSSTPITPIEDYHPAFPKRSSTWIIIHEHCPSLHASLIITTYCHYLSPSGTNVI